MDRCANSTIPHTFDILHLRIHLHDPISKNKQCHPTLPFTSSPRSVLHPRTVRYTPKPTAIVKSPRPSRHCHASRRPIQNTAKLPRQRSRDHASHTIATPRRQPARSHVSIQRNGRRIPRLRLRRPRRSVMPCYIALPPQAPLARTRAYSSKPGQSWDRRLESIV